jgi:hypothetical protein
MCWDGVLKQGWVKPTPIWVEVGWTGRGVVGVADSN